MPELKLTWQDMADLLEEYIPQELADDELTAGRLARKRGVYPQTARSYLELWEKEGIVEFVGWRRTGNSPNVRAYKMVRNGDKK